jgi:hypothetical protein
MTHAVEEIAGTQICDLTWVNAFDSCCNRGGTELLRGLDGPGPRSVCRVLLADPTSANKIQGPGFRRNSGPGESWPHPAPRYSSSAYDKPRSNSANPPTPEPTCAKLAASKESGQGSVGPPVALALGLAVIIVVRRRPGHGSPLRSQHVTAARWVGRIEHHALIRRPRHFTFLEVREVELAPRKRDAV